jgi:hypothetical protein
MLVHFWPFGIFYGQLVYFMPILYIGVFIWYIVPVFGLLYQEESGIPVFDGKELFRKLVPGPDLVAA